MAVAALLDPPRHAGKSYRPIGPKLLTVTEMAAVIGHVVGHKVRHVRTPLWMFYKAAKAQGNKPILLSGLRHYFQDHDRGAFAVGAPNDTIRELTGKDAEDFETIARRHGALPESRQSFGARLAAFARFMAVPAWFQKSVISWIPDGSVDSLQLAGLTNFTSWGSPRPNS